MTANVLNLSASAGREALPALTDGARAECTIRLEPLLGDSTDVDWTTSASICLLVDCSGSMRGEKIAAAVLTWAFERGDWFPGTTIAGFAGKITSCDCL